MANLVDDAIVNPGLPSGEAEGDAATAALLADVEMPTPLQIVDLSLGSRIRVLMKDSREVTGILAGFDDYLNLILENAVATSIIPPTASSAAKLQRDSLPQCLLAASNVCMIVPGEEGADESTQQQ